MSLNTKITKWQIVLCVCLGMTGCVVSSQPTSTLDAYDPRNNIPLLQASSRNTELATSTNMESAASGGAFKTLSVQAQKLRELKVLKDEGVLTQKEYDTKKTEILKSM